MAGELLCYACIQVQFAIVGHTSIMSNEKNSLLRKDEETKEYGTIFEKMNALLAKFQAQTKSEPVLSQLFVEYYSNVPTEHEDNSSEIVESLVGRAEDDAFFLFDRIRLVWIGMDWISSLPSKSALFYLYLLH